MNKSILIGRLTRDPELRFGQGSGTAVCRFTLAVARQYKKDETDFINCVAFGKTAETISQYFTKGRLIAVAGSIRTGSYETPDGIKKYTFDVAIDTFDFIDSKNNSAEQANNVATSNNANNTEAMNNNFGNNDDIMPVDDGDMPF